MPGWVDWGHCCSWGRSTCRVSVGQCSPSAAGCRVGWALWLAARGMGPGHPWELGTRSGCLLVCEAARLWVHGAVGMMGCRMNGWRGSWGAVWLAGHGGSGHGAGLAGVQVPCVSTVVGCHVALWLAGHFSDPILGASVTCGRGPTARQCWRQPRGRVHCRCRCHGAVGSLCPAAFGHLPTWGSGWGGTGVNGGLSPWCLQLCLPSSYAASRGASCLPAGRHHCRHGRSPRHPRDPSVHAGRRLQPAGGDRLCHMEPEAPGTTEARAWAGAGTWAP